MSVQKIKAPEVWNSQKFGLSIYILISTAKKVAVASNSERPKYCGGIQIWMSKTLFLAVYHIMVLFHSQSGFSTLLVVLLVLILEEGLAAI